MQSGNIPAKFATAWASGASASFTRSIPQPSQQTVAPGAASYTDGFPPICFQPVGSGGVPPFGQDFNGIFNAITLAIQWKNAGGQYGYDATFCTAIEGYPKGAILQAATGGFNFWLNTVEANTSNPDAAGAGWTAFQMGGAAVATIINEIIQTGTFQQVAVNPIIYVSPTGNDNNSGTTAQSPKLTIANAASTLTNAYNFATSSGIIQLASGTYAAPGSMPVGSGTILIQGDTTGSGAANYVITGNGAGQGALIAANSPINLTGLTISNTGTTAHNFSSLSGSTCFMTNVASVMQATSTVAHFFGRNIQFNAGCTISGNALAAFWPAGSGIFAVNVGTTVTILGNPTFSGATLFMTDLSTFTLLSGASVVASGTVTGPRYSVVQNSVAVMNGAGANAIPGSTAGTTNSGGQYAL